LGTDALRLTTDTLLLATATALVVFGAMAIEARRAARNEQAQLARGGVEPPGDVYNLMRLVYPLAFVAMIAEGAVRGAPQTAVLFAGALTLAAAKALKWWAIVSLGPLWTFRVIVVPGVPLVRRGPYRWLRHPNYVAVVGEFAGVALLAGAVWAGAVSVVVFGMLLARRIAVEERALAAALGGPATSKK
jgi:methyltransferase